MTSMNGLTNILDVLGNHPATKWVALALALRALWTVIAWQRCPLIHDAAPADAGAKAARSAAGQMWRFVGLMLAGIALAVLGLFGLAKEGEAAPIALFMLAGGIYLFSTEPARRNLTEAQNRVIAAATQPREAREHCISMLRDTHVKLVGVEVGILALIVLGMSVV